MYGVHFSWAQLEDWPDELSLSNKVYQPFVRTVQLYPQGAMLSEPYLQLGFGGSLELHFDDMEAEYRDLYFTIIHCTHDWRASDLMPADYMTGFRENSIQQVEDSFNTYRSYTHYTAQFPNDMSGLQLSGNYILVVYEDGDKDELVLTKRFVVYESLVNIESRVHEATAVENSRYGQEVDFTVHHPDFDIRNPYTDFHITVLQNNRWDNAITDLAPRFVKGNELSYDYSKENNFDGGNEWRQIDVKDLQYGTYEVDSVGVLDGEVHCWLAPFGKRTFKQYRNEPDIEGKFLIKNDYAGDNNLEAEYVMTHFRLPFDFELSDAEVYVFGDLTQFEYLPEFRMKYNAARRAYELVVPIKQGFTNYQYGVLKNREDVIDLGVIEGSHRQTHNIYSIFAYNLDPFMGYDRVVGATFTDSFNGR